MIPPPTITPLVNISAPLGAFAAYFSPIAQVAGALLGLVFVALTFNPKTLGMRHDPGLRSLAEQVFADFLMVMIVSLILLIPGDVVPAVSTVMALLGVLGLLRLVRSAWVLVRSHRALQSRALLLRFWLSALGNAGFILAGIYMARGTVPGIAGLALVASPLMLLVSGSRSAWFLVMRNTD